ncbi:MAG: histidinol dehydrogenase, partial [Mesorhizobium sp.]
IAALQARYAALGPPDPNFDMKAFTDEMWED